MRVVLDPNVIVSALLAPSGAPARVLQAWMEGDYELIVSPALLAELEQILAYPKIASRVTQSEANELIDLLRTESTTIEDPTSAPSTPSPDPGDDYLVALGEHARARIVSGDKHLLSLADQVPVASPRAFIDEIERHGREIS
jgi:uncharacterized protein